MLVVGSYLLDFASEQSPQVIQQQRQIHPHDCHVRPQTEQKTLQLRLYSSQSNNSGSGSDCEQTQLRIGAGRNNRLSFHWHWRHVAYPAGS